MTIKSGNIASLVKPAIRKLAAYHVDETPVRVKLDAMENPFPLPASLRNAVATAVRDTPVNRYPDPSGKELKKAIAAMWGMEPAQMVLGNGSDELIQAIVLAFGGPVVTPVPSFAMYELTARALSQDVVPVPLLPDFDLDADRLIAAARKARARVVFLACPNNPTGNRFSDKAIRKVLADLRAAIVIDEAYFSFSGKTWLPRLAKHPNMVVLRTLSKIGFAGLRLGVLCASPDIVKELNKIRLPYNINALSQAAALVALRSRNAIERQISVLISEREKLYNNLSQLPGITAFPSETNFLLLRTGSDATKIFAQLKRSGILVKNLDRPGPLRNCLRVTIGTPSENREFLKKLSALITKEQRRLAPRRKVAK